MTNRFEYFALTNVVQYTQLLSVTLKLYMLKYVKIHSTIPLPPSSGEKFRTMKNANEEVIQKIIRKVFDQKGLKTRLEMYLGPC